MFHDVSEYCKSCDACQKSAGKTLATKVKLIPLPVVDVSFKRIAMDIVGPLDRSGSGCRFILVICGYATRYPEAVALKSIEAEVITEELMKLFSRVGVTDQEILTYQGSHFNSQLLKEVYRMLKVQPIRTSPNHPDTDGLCERPNNRNKLLPYLLFAYREVPQASTGFLPFGLLYGKEVRGPLDAVKEIWEADQRSSEDIITYVLRMRERLEEMTEEAQTNLAAAPQRQNLV